jgi:hypothetical protein
LTKSKEIDDGRIYTIGRICIDGADVGAVYAASVPCDTGALIAEVVGNRVRLRRGSRELRVDLSAAELMAAAAACRAWQSARSGFAPSQLRVARSHYAGMLVDPADPSTIATRHPVAARAVENEVMLVAEFRVVERRDHAGALAGAVYAMPGDWSLEGRHHRAELVRGAARMVLGPEDVRFLAALGTTLRVQAGAARDATWASAETARAPGSTDAPRHKPAHEMTAEEIAEAFTLP